MDSSAAKCYSGICVQMYIYTYIYIYIGIYIYILLVIAQQDTNVDGLSSYSGLTYKKTPILFLELFKLVSYRNSPTGG